MFRDKAKVGDGSLATATRLEIKYGILTGGKSHITKTKERISNLSKILKTQDLTNEKINIANDLIVELRRALNGK